MVEVKFTFTDVSIEVIGNLNGNSEEVETSTDVDRTGVGGPI